MNKSIYSAKHKKLCEFLVLARNNAEFTQQGLARKLGRHQSFISKYEGGERRLDLIELLEISKILNFDLKALIKTLSD